MEIMDDTIHDGPRAIEKIKQIVRQVSDEIDAYENQGEEVPAPENMFPPEHEDEIAKLLAVNQDDLLTRTPEEEKLPPPTKQLADMDITELNDELQRALEYEDYKRAAQVRDEINAR
jgi:excinuclease UvrABC helicase subunit UvrB